jgi:WhiB family redox-sensing transcriptional regulator
MEQPIPMTTSWQQQSACRGLDPSIFFPVTDDDAERAKDICGRCAVQEHCLEHALRSREHEGVWGGCTERERRRIIRRRRRKAS